MPRGASARTLAPGPLRVPALSPALGAALGSSPALGLDPGATPGVTEAPGRPTTLRRGLTASGVLACGAVRTGAAALSLGGATAQLVGSSYSLGVPAGSALGPCPIGAPLLSGALTVTRRRRLRRHGGPLVAASCLLGLRLGGGGEREGERQGEQRE